MAKLTEEEIKVRRAEALLKWPKKEICIRCGYRKKGLHMRFFCLICFKVVSKSGGRSEGDYAYGGDCKGSGLSIHGDAQVKRRKRREREKRERDAASLKAFLERHANKEEAKSEEEVGNDKRYKEIIIYD